MVKVRELNIPLTYVKKWINPVWLLGWRKKVDKTTKSSYISTMKEITLEDIAIAIKGGNKVEINEASLGRVYQHITRDASKSFAILTAFRGGNSKQQNLQRNK